jgi:ABC-type Na+ efflux pump permease subunit
MTTLTPVLTIARYTLLEALRNRLVWLLLLIALAAIGLAGFLGDIALTESRQVQAALLAAGLRFAAVFLTITFVVTSMLREASDKGLELLLALALPRAAYLLGKLCGFAALALLPAMLFGALCLFFAPWDQCLLWAASLACELWIAAAFSLLCVLSFNQPLPALAATLAFYLLARAIGSLQLIAHGPFNSHSAAQRFIGGMLDVIAAVLPRLDQFTRTEWLVYHGGDAMALAGIAAQTAICVGLLTAAALFDLYRKNL